MRRELRVLSLKERIVDNPFPVVIYSIGESRYRVQSAFSIHPKMTKSKIDCLSKSGDLADEIEEIYLFSNLITPAID